MSFPLKRATTVTFGLTEVDVPRRPVGFGQVRYWTADGAQVPVPGRRVNFRAWRTSAGPTSIVGSTTTYVNGRYAVSLPVSNGMAVRAEVPSTPAPTSSPVIRPGTKMSTFGRLLDGGDRGHHRHRLLLRELVRQVDADVRVVFASPYQTVRSAYRWLTFVDVH